MSDKTREQIIVALRGGRSSSEPIELAPGVTVTLKVVPAAKKDELRDEAEKAVPMDAASRPERVFSQLVMRMLAASLEHHGISFEDVRDNIAAPVLKRLIGEYERLEAVVAPATEEELERTHEEVMAIVGESPSAAAAHLSGLGYTTLLRFALSMVARQSS